MIYLAFMTGSGSSQTDVQTSLANTVAQML